MNIRKFLNQAALYWAPSTEKDVYGNEAYEFPIEVRVRLVMSTQRRSTPLTDIDLPSATVLTADEMVVGGQIALGTFMDLSELSEPSENGAVMIRKIQPYVDRGGNLMGWEVTTDASFTLSRAGSM